MFVFRIDMSLFQFTIFLGWGLVWLIIAFAFFAAGIIVGLVAFKVWNTPRFLCLSETLKFFAKKQSAEQQREDASRFLPVPGSSNSGISLSPASSVSVLVSAIVCTAHVLMNL